MKRLVMMTLAAANVIACGSSVVPAGSDAQTDPYTPPDGSATCMAAPPAPVSISYHVPRDSTLDCSTRMATQGIIDEYAAVVDVQDDANGSTIHLDFCSPAADCSGVIPGSVAIQAAGFALGAGPSALRPGQYLHIRSRTSLSLGCTMQIEIYNAPTWSGAANPVRSDGALIAAASQGESTSLPVPVPGPGSGITVGRREIGCPMTHGCSSPGEQFALSFQPSCLCDMLVPPVLLGQGARRTFANLASRYEAYNAASVETGACDASGDYGWTIRQVQ